MGTDHSTVVTTRVEPRLIPLYLFRTPDAFASQMEAFVKITLPLVKGGILATALFISNPALRTSIGAQLFSAVLSLAEVVSDVRPQVIAVVGESAGDNDTSGDSGDLTVEDVYESANF